MIPVTDLDATQREIYDIVPRSAERKLAHGPVTVLFNSPEFGRQLQRLGVFIHDHTSFETRLKELIILTVARDWGAHYPWNSHASAAVKRGVPVNVMEAIWQGQEPKFERDDEALVYHVTRSILKTRNIPDDLYERAVKAFGMKAMVELVGIVGYYTYVSMMANCFELEPGSACDYELPG